jgi:hypothetical protein
MQKIQGLRFKCIRHLAAMQETGNHHSIYIVTDANTINLTRFLRRFFIKRLGYRPQYHLFWLSTTEGTMLCVSGDMTIRRIMGDFFQEAINLSHCSTASPFYIGSSKHELAKAIAIGILHYQPKGRAKSFGGSVISATAAAKAAKAITEKAIHAYNKGIRQ